MRDEFAQAGWELWIDYGTDEVPLLGAYPSQVQMVELSDPCDGADTLMITMFARHPDNGEIVGVDDTYRRDGTSLKLRAGYGDDLITMGRFTITKIEVESPPTEEAVATITAFDGFQRFMLDTYPGDYGNEVKTYSDVALTMARKYGMGVAADTSIPIPHRTRTRRKRNGKKVKVKSRVIKNAGDTDAKMIKHLAAMSGFLSPKVRYVEAHSTLARQLKKNHDIVEAVDNRDVLFFRRLDMRRQIQERSSESFLFNARPEGDGMVTLTAFKSGVDTSNLPAAVRMTGIVEGPPKEVVTVEAEVTGAAEIAERTALRRQAALTQDPQERSDLLERADALDSKVRVREVNRVRFKRTKKRNKVQNAEAVLIEVLDQERKPVIEYSHRAKKRVQTLRRETIRSTMVVASGSNLNAMAKAWLQGRLELHHIATATVANIAGLETLRTNQIHEFRGVNERDDGYWVIMSANHICTRDAGHTVSLALKRIPDLSSKIAARGQAAE